jgi:hypothetical protein
MTFKNFVYKSAVHRTAAGNLLQPVPLFRVKIAAQHRLAVEHLNHGVIVFFAGFAGFAVAGVNPFVA